ncbi:MAG: hypothetical protein EXS63_08375 [Candidatus Omnitrophica bacterium]|nr:hypothetical protein [Candidatus Omnitrophota bacterium]
MKKSTKWIALAVMAIMLVPSVGFAASPWKEKGGSYADITKGKLDFGLKNLLAGWTELIRKPMHAERSVSGMVMGLGKGIMNGVLYTAGGLLHTATFPISVLDIPIPDNGVQF